MNLLNILKIFLILILIYLLISGKFSKNKLEGNIRTYKDKNYKFKVIMGITLSINGLYNFINSYPMYLSQIILGILLLHQSLEKLTIGNNGICIHGYFLSWDEFIYYWNKDRKIELVIKVNKRTIFLLYQPYISWIIEKDKYGEIDEILKNHVEKIYP